MIGLLLLLGVGIAAGVLSSGDSSEGAPAPGASGLDPDTDIVVDEEFRAATSAELSPAEFAEVTFLAGPLDVNTGAGADLVIGGSGDDQILTGAGEDLVVGGAGDDTIGLGAGDDLAGVDPRFPDDGLSPAFGNVDLGDDVIRGGGGNDELVDAYGSNTIFGNQDNDIIFTLDFDEDTTEATPDTVDGGAGDDLMFVDRGDEVTTGGGDDGVLVDVTSYDDGGDDIETVTITDFDPARDAIGIYGDAEDVEPRAGETGSPITVMPASDGLSSTVFLRGEAVAVVVGGASLTPADISIVTA